MRNKDYIPAWLVAYALMISLLVYLLFKTF